MTPLLVAERLGFKIERSRATGVHEGCAVLIRINAYSDQATVIVSAFFAPALDLGLELKHRVLTPVFPVPYLDDLDLDSEFSIDGDEIDRVRALFDPPLRAHIVGANRNALELAISDTCCSARSATPIGMLEEAWTESALAAVTRTAKLVDAARASVPAPRELRAHAAVFADLAARNHLVLSRAPLAAWGSVDSMRVTLGSKRVALDCHDLAAHIAFEEPLAFGLLLCRQTFVDDVRVFFGALDDIRVGDAPFDRRFLIRAAAPHRSRVPPALPADVRASLLDLDARFGAVSVDDAGISVAPISSSVSPSKLPKLFDALVELGARIPASIREHQGPYR